MKPPQATVAQPRVWLGLDHLPPVLPRVRAQVLTEKLFDSQVDDVIDQRAADQKLHRQVVNPLGILAVMRLLGQQPALGEEVSKHAGHRLEALALAGVLQRNSVVEHEVPIIVLRIGKTD